MALLRSKFRRKREGKTSYKLRLSLVKSRELRFVVRKTNKNMIVQIVHFNENGDRVVIGVDSSSLKKFGWSYNRGNIPCAYLTGYLCGVKAIKKKVNMAVVDIGMSCSTKGNRLYACIKGAVDAGMKINCSEKMYPSEKRIKGIHLKKDMGSLFEKVKEMVKKNG